MMIHHIEKQKLKQETMAVPACYVPVCLKKKHNVRKAVWFTKATVDWRNHPANHPTNHATNHPMDDP